MGLLDGAMDSDQFRLGLGLLAAGGARSDGMGFGGRVQEAVSGLDKFKRQKEVLEYEKLRNEQERQAVLERRQAQEQQRINPQAIAGHKGFKVFVNMKDEIDEIGGYFHSPGF